jgi:zinc D-Ala-D-Ala carboxypeptidase
MPVQLLSLVMALVSALSVSVSTIGEATTLGGYLALVNRDYVLPADYEPDDLVRPDVKTTNGSAILMRAEAAQALEELFAAAKDEAGLTIYAVSGYRSYSTQAAIFERKIKNTGSKEKAQRLVAPPGASEHQLGLAMDLKASPDGNLSAAFAKTKQGQWVAENAHRFGFIIRYKEEWTDITGYSYEPWHIRYVGKEHAAIIYEMDIPLETYIEALREAALDEYLKEE